MMLTTDIITYIIKTFVVNIYVCYLFDKILKTKSFSLRNSIIVLVSNVLITALATYIEFFVNTFISAIILCLMFGILLGVLTKRKLGYSIIVTITAYAISFICQGIAAIIQFIPYKIIYKCFNIESRVLSLVIILVIQYLLMFAFFKIKKFKNGFSFLENKFNNEITDIIMMNIGTIVMIIYSLTGTHYDEITRNFFIAFSILGTTMFLTIQKMLTMYYKQKLLTDTMEEYKKELVEKQNEIDLLKQDKKNVSKITHEFYNRQKALELIVASNMNADNIDKENISPNVLKIIESLTNEYSERFEQTKELPKLDETGIPEIDNMFKYMQTECCSNNINFNLKIMGNIHYLVNNIIPKNKLETLIGDHLRDAINAVNLIDEDNKEIIAILGIKNKKYELSIYDNGVDFTIDTLMKLGLEAVTTNAERGGTGTGFLTTFETLAETKASLIITEYPKTKDNRYTKCVTIKFDGKKQYKICSYRAEDIKLTSNSNRIKIEGIKSK